MRYYLDCEFNGYRGALISMALVHEDGVREMYFAHHCRDPIGWVAENVMPIVRVGDAQAAYIPVGWAGKVIQDFLRGDNNPCVIADWPDDIRYFCEAIITDPGEMIDIPGLKMEVHRVDAYPTDLPGAVQHNALWDARALRHKLSIR